MASDRLSALLNDLSDCLMAASDSTSSPYGSELQLSTRMRTVLVSLLGECIDVKTGEKFASLLQKSCPGSFCRFLPDIHRGKVSVLTQWLPMQ